MDTATPFTLFALRRFDRLALAPGNIELWAAPLDPSPGCVEQLHGLLARDERERAARFHFDRDRRRSIVSRGLLRLLLAGYTGLSARELRFVYGPKDKPFLADDLAAEIAARLSAPLEFNVSHSHELVLIGFHLGRPLGVDVEHVRPMPDGRSISEHFFSKPEREVLARISDEGLADAFFRCWTRKEAYIKAVGDGLSIPLDCFDVTLHPEDPVQFLALNGDPALAAGWSLFHLVPAEGYFGAVALEGRGYTLQGHRLDADRLDL